MTFRHGPQLYRILPSPSTKILVIGLGAETHLKE